jgi:hypothetical protein
LLEGATTSSYDSSPRAKLYFQTEVFQEWS